jgi:NAD(P)H-flavin reductase
MNQLSVKQEAQVLVRTSIPCGGIADCGVCAVMTKSNWKLACKDGPVFDLKEL